MLRRFPALVFLMLVFTLPAHAQTEFLDALPPCNFTAAAPDRNMRIGAVLYNFDTGNGCAENLDELFPVASVPKIFVAAALYQTILESNGAITFDTPLTFTERYWMGGRTDCLNAASLEQEVTLGLMSDIMISCSDNASTWMIMDAIGWETVDTYVDSLGIEGIGQVIPYAEVDRQKLVFLDERWQNVPISMASRFYRSEGTTGLNTYFDEIPTYTIEDEIRANELYFEANTFNSATPRAMAAYLLKLAADSPNNDNDGQIARWVFGSMLLTQRQYTSQAIPGTISVGAKNGFDTGLRAEVNVMFPDLPDQQRNPNAIAIIFAHQTDFSAPNLQPPRTVDGDAINQYLLQLAPTISRILYPNYIKPTETVYAPIISSITVNPKAVMDACWTPYERRGYLFQYRGELESCWLSQGRSQFLPGDFIGIGMVLYDMNQRDTRFNFIFTDPDGVRRSYHTERFLIDSTAIYWFHPIPQSKIGTWLVDVFLNRELVYTEQIEVERLSP